MKKILFLSLFLCIVCGLLQAQTVVTINKGTISWICPAGVTSIQVECWGAGGAGGGTTTNSSKYVGGGGAGGNYVKNTSVTVVPGTTYTVSIGAGGVNTSTTGAAGGATSFSGITTISAAGGGGGLPGNSASSGAGAGGAASATTNNTGYSGSSSYSGGNGSVASWVSSSNSTSGGGGSSAGNSSNGNNGTAPTGGAAPTGGYAGTNGKTTDGAPTNASNSYGFGGAGARGSALKGSVGGDGLIMITYTSGNPVAPTLTPAASATVDGAFEVTFTDDAAWRGAITGITVNGTTLDPSAYNMAVASKITFTPSASTLLQSSGTKSIVISATGYENGTGSQVIGAGTATKLGVKTQPVPPVGIGSALSFTQQPAVFVQDQYGNTVTTSTASITAAVGSGSWTLGGTSSINAVDGVATFSAITANTAIALTGATITFTSSGLTSANSAPFDLSNNLIPFGSFESWTNTAAMPDSWNYGTGALVTNYIYATDVRQGKVLRLADLIGGAKRINTTFNFEILTEGIYRVSFKVKGNVSLRGVVLVKGTATPSTTTPSPTNHPILTSDYSTPTVVNDWTTLQYDIIVPSTATFGTDYRLHISWSNSACDFQIDDITLVKCINCDVVLANGGHLSIDQSTSYNSIKVRPGAKLTLNSTLTTTGITLESDENGTATLIDNTPTANTTVKQYLSSARNWYFTPAVSGVTVPTGTTLIGYDETGGASGTDFWNYFTVGNSIVPGKGYIIQPGASTTVSYTSTTNSGNIPVTLTYNATKGKGFNLVGNPYPSYLSWSTLVADNAAANMPTGTMWYRTANYNGKSVWAPTTGYNVNDIVYNGTRFYKATTAGTSAASGGPIGSGTGITDNSVIWDYEGSIYMFATVNASGVATPSTVSNLIPPMQAFWVKSNGGTLIFKNDYRTHNTGGANAFKAPQSNATSNKLVRLMVNNGASTDEIVIYANANAANTFDRYDAPKYFNTVGSNQPEIYTLTGSEKLAINAMNSFSIDTEIALGLSTERANTFTLKATELINIDSNLRVVLRDKVNKTEFDLTDEETYNFSSDAVNDANRFSLLFRAPGVTTSTENHLNGTVSVYANYQNQLVINANKGSKYAIYNTVGQLVKNGTLKNKLHTVNYKLTQGVYLVKVDNQLTKVVAP